MTDALAGLRILELSSGPATGLASMILADFGAEVILIKQNVEDPFSSHPAASMWQRNKRKLDLDLDSKDDLFRLHKLLSGADVMICNWSLETLRHYKLNYPGVHNQHPHLVFAHLTGFGPTGPRSGIPGYEHVVAASTGRMNTFSGTVDRAGPVFSALHVATHASAQALASGILAAVHSQRLTGTGKLVETSILQGFLPYEQNTLLARQFRERLPERQPGSDKGPPLPAIFYHPAQAADGRWLQFGNLLPHLFANFLEVTGLDDIARDPDWNPTEMKLPPDKLETFRSRMLGRIQERTSDEWMNDCIKQGSVVATRYQTTQEALADPDIVSNGHVVERENRLELGPVATLSKTPASLRSLASDAGTLEKEWSNSPRPVPKRKANTTLPLAGIKVVEAATIIAGPLAASFLADMGAEVIKVEPIGGDPYRRMALGVGYLRVNAGKQSIAVDLKTESGQEIMHGLLADADVFIHNFRPGVPERLGIDYPQLSDINPQLIYIQSNGYGPHGPGARRPSTHPIPGAAIGGALFQLRENVPTELLNDEGLRLWSSRLMKANDVNPDPNTSSVICTAAMIGLTARINTGRGQQIWVDMFGANAYANYDDFVSYDGKNARAQADSLGMGLGPTYRLYRSCSDTWVFLAIPTAKEQQCFLRILKSIGVDPQQLPDFGGDQDLLANSLQELFLEKTADDWENLFCPEGIACLQADGRDLARFLMNDEQSKHLGLTQTAVHPLWGEYQRHGANVHFDGRPPSLKPPPYSGQHSAVLLQSLGYPQDRIQQLFDDNIVWCQPVDRDTDKS